MIGAIIAGGAALASSILAARSAKRNTDKQNEANKEMAKYQYSQDLEMWNKGNKYNDPLAQMERLKGAGLNPNIVYGSGSAAGNTATQLPKYNAPTMSYNYRPAVDPLTMLGAYQDFRIKQAQTKSMEADAMFKGGSLENRLDLLNSQRQGAEQKVDKTATEIGWMNANTDTPPWNKYSQMKHFQASALDAAGRQKEEGIINMLRQRDKLELDTQYRQKELDNFLTKMWSQLIYGGANAVSKFK